MKDVTLAVITRLKADTPVANVVGARIYRKGSIPTNPVAPYIIVSKVDPIRPSTTHNRTRTGKTRIQCSVFASTDVVADNLSELVADSLNMVTDTYMAPGVFAISIFDQGAVPDENTAIPLYMFHRDFMITHNV
jgi:hypothetical protein